MCEIGCGKRYRHRLRKAPASRKSLRPRNRGLLILQTICASETWVNAALRPSTLTGNAKFAEEGGNERFGRRTLGAGESVGDGDERWYIVD
jgi:hypothetical protein